MWVTINLLQSVFTGLHSDESYYWMYSKNLDWGYFDHPPMAALLIFAGQWLDAGELGVRLLMVLLSTITFALILNELKEKNDMPFVFLFMLSFPLIHTHISGFLAIPDIPLLFFTMWFLILYRKFLEQPGWVLSFLLALVTAGMIYSKYHAFLVIGFTVFSNPRLLKNRFFYTTALFTAILMLPHFLWQLHNDFPTFTYHLVERAKPFQFKYVVPYVAGLLVTAGPLSGFLIFYKLRKFKPATPFERALIFNILGFYFLFFVMSFKNRIELHWVAAIIPMLMILSYPLISNDPGMKKWFVRLALPVVILIGLFRIYIALDVIPNLGHLKITFYQRKASALEIKKMADGKKVGFFNNYAAASNYVFYTGDPVVHLSAPDYRFCQYDLWDDESYARGENILTVQSKHMNPDHLIKTVTGETKGFVPVENFQPLQGLMLEPDTVITGIYLKEFRFLLKNQTSFPIFTRHDSSPVLGVMQNKTEITSFPLYFSTEKEVILPGKSAKISLFLDKNIVSEKSPLVFYTRTKEKIRGEILVIK